MDAQLIHNVKNKLFMVTLLLDKIENQKHTVEKIKNIIDFLNRDCLQINSSRIDSLININEEFKYISSHFDGLDCETVFDNELEFIGDKSFFYNVIINILKNSKEAKATQVKAKIKCRTLTITDNGECFSRALDKLNNGDAFTTKEKGYGLGTQAIRQFCETNNCQLSFSMPNNSMSIEIIFP